MRAMRKGVSKHTMPEFAQVGENDKVTLGDKIK